jgi:trimeric autotransporter adhesin
MPFINRIGSGATRKFGFGAGMKPGAPTSVVGTVGNTQVSVAFTAPAVLGTGTISYTATSSPGSFTATGASSPLVVTGLTNGTAYTFTVTATNAFGSSTSASSASVTPATVPSTPSAPTATRGDTSVALSWTAPANGGSAITDYVVQYRYIDPFTWKHFRMEQVQQHQQPLLV